MMFLSGPIDIALVGEHTEGALANIYVARPRSEGHPSTKLPFWQGGPRVVETVFEDASGDFWLYFNGVMPQGKKEFP